MDEQKYNLIMEEFKGIKATQAVIQKDVKTGFFIINGRVRTLEISKGFLWGGLTVLGILLTYILNIVTKG